VKTVKTDFIITYVYSQGQNILYMALNKNLNALL